MIAGLLPGFEAAASLTRTRSPTIQRRTVG